jgi:Xaa-Pro aminopeptidase
MLLSRLLQRAHATSPAAHAAARIAHLSPSHRAFHGSAIRRALDMEKVNTTARLAELRKLMQERQIDVYSNASPRHDGTYVTNQ